MPLGLWRLAGWPLPSSLPRWSVVSRALGQSEISDAVLLKAAASLCWAAWLALAAAVLVEAVAWVRGRTARRLPLVGPLQVWVGRLMASALLLLSSLGGLARTVEAAPVALRAAPMTALPASPRPTAAIPEQPHPVPGKQYVVHPPEGRRRDTLWGIAERYLGNPQRWPEIFELNRGRTSAGHRLTDPHWIYPGEVLLMPDDAVGVDGPREALTIVVDPPAPATLAVQDLPVARQEPGQGSFVPPASHQPVPASAASTIDAVALRDVSPATAGGLRLTQAALLAAGVVGTLDLLRRVQRRHHRASQPIRFPGSEPARTELYLRAAADLESASALEVALGALAGSGGRGGMLLKLRNRRLDVLVDAPDGVQPFPGRRLMTVGRTVAQDQILLDVQAAGLTAIAGDARSAQRVLNAAAVELATRVPRDPPTLVLVGFGDALVGLPHVRVVESVADVIDELEKARASTVLLCSRRPAPALARRVWRLALDDGCPVAALVAGRVDQARCRLTHDGGAVRIDPPGLELSPEGLTGEATGAIGRLLSSALDPDDGLVTDAARPDAAVGRQLSTSPEIEVQVLGRVGMSGSARPLLRAKSMELIVFLAMHRESAITADRLREALWPGRDAGATTLYTTASVARRHLGRAADGSFHLPQLAAGAPTYHLRQSVQLDYELFSAEVARARAEEPAEAAATFRSALTRVRGRPFDVTGRGYDWLHVEGTSSFVELEVAGAAHRLARICLECGDGEGARWAVRQGLRASPGNEQLFRDEMCAADLEGNPAGVEAVMADLTRVVAEEGAYGSFHPETVALYRQLSRSWQSAS